MFQILSVLSITHWAQLNSLGPSLFRPASLARQLLLYPVSPIEEEENEEERDEEDEEENEEENAGWSLIRILAVMSCSSRARTENIMVSHRI